MIKYLKYVFLIPFLISLCGCDDDKEGDPEYPSSGSEYYVKYEGTVKTPYITNDIKYSVVTENGSITFTSGTSFSQTFGPVKKGFLAGITADATNIGNAQCEVRIYVCRGSEPFALKATDSGGKYVTAVYTIDY